MARKPRRRKSGSNSWLGNILLEMVAVVAFLLALSMTNAAPDQSTHSSGSQGISDLTTTISGFVSDQFSLHNNNY